MWWMMCFGKKMTLSWKVTWYFSAIFIGNTEGWGLLSDNEAADWQPEPFVRRAWVGAHVARYWVVCLQPEPDERFNSIPKNKTAPNCTWLNTTTAENASTRSEKISATSSWSWSYTAQNNSNISQSLLPGWHRWGNLAQYFTSRNIFSFPSGFWSGFFD